MKPNRTCLKKPKLEPNRTVETVKLLSRGRCLLLEGRYFLSYDGRRCESAHMSVEAETQHSLHYCCCYCYYYYYYYYIRISCFILFRHSQSGRKNNTTAEVPSSASTGKKKKEKKFAPASTLHLRWDREGMLNSCLFPALWRLFFVLLLMSSLACRKLFSLILRDTLFQKE